MKSAELDLFIVKLNKYKKNLKLKTDEISNISKDDKELIYNLIDKINIFLNNLYIKDYIEIEDLNRLLDNLESNIKKITFIEKDEEHYGYISFKRKTLFLNKNSNIDLLMIFYYKSLVKASRTSNNLESFNNKELKKLKNYGAEVLNKVTAQDIAEEIFYLEKNYPRLEIPYIPNKNDNYLESDFYYRSNLKNYSLFQPLAIEFVNALIGKKYRYNTYKKLMRDLNKLSFKENIGQMIYDKFNKKGLTDEYIKIMELFDYLIKHKKRSIITNQIDKTTATKKFIEATKLINNIQFLKL